MVRKTMKDLDEEIVQLNNVMNDVKRMLDEVYKKYDDLEERVLNSVTDDDHGCSVCDKKFTNKQKNGKSIQKNIKLMLVLFLVKFVNEFLMKNGS